MFKLHVAVTRASVDAMKADLTKTLPDVKSCHRCEALARALAFRTYATLRTAIAEPAGAGIREANAGVFAAYLADHGFTVDTRRFHHAAARTAIAAVLAAELQLNTRGYGAGDSRRVNGVRETLADRARRVEAARSEFMHEGCVEEFLLALAFVSRLTPSKVVNPRADSYDLKHDAERQPCTYPDGQRLGPAYVSNGAFIVAAVHAGFRFKTHERFGAWPSLNVTFNISSRSIAKATEMPDEPNASPLRRSRPNGWNQATLH